MGINVSRIGDIGVGICYAHDPPIPATGPIVEGAVNVFANGINVARITDTVVTFHNSSHSGNIVEGSPSVFANGLNVARIGDLFTGIFVGTLVEGAPTVFAQ